MIIKVTDQNGQTRNKTQWGPGVTHTAPGTGELCTNGWLHAYEGLGTAVMLNPIHGHIKEPRFWKARGKVEKRDGRRKFGTTKLTTLEEIKVVLPSSEERVVCAITLAMSLLPPEDSPEWFDWAEGYLSGERRGKDTYFSSLDLTSPYANIAYYAAFAACNANSVDYAINAANVAALFINIDKVACAVFGY